MVTVPVNFQKRQDTVTEVTTSSDIPFVAKIVRGSLFPGTVYKAVVRPRIVRMAYDYLVENQTFFHEGYDAAHGLQPGFMGRLPEKTFAPGQGFRPANFLALAKPFSKVMPIFSPKAWATWMIRTGKEQLNWNGQFTCCAVLGRISSSLPCSCSQKQFALTPKR